MTEQAAIRYEPGHLGVKSGYEHMHRYLLAAALAPGKRVLDLASGEGYGCAILGAQARSVTGVEIDKAALTRAKQRYGNQRVHFIQGSMTAVPVRDQQFDL